MENHGHETVHYLPVLAVVDHAPTDCLDNIALSFLIEVPDVVLGEFHVVHDELVVMTPVQIVPETAAGPVTEDLSHVEWRTRILTVIAIKQGQLVHGEPR